MSSSERYHSLDALRAFALLLGVVFHAAESFIAGHLDWAIVDASPSLSLDIFRHASHAFRMEIFFLIAGFFARLLYHGRGWRGFWRNRLGRIVAPLVVGWFVLYPILVFLWIWGAQKSGNWTRIELPPEYRSLPPWKLAAGFFASGQFVPAFDLTHLWFLHQLTVIYVLALGIRAAIRTWAGPSGRLAEGLDQALGKALRPRAGMLLLAGITVPLLLTMDGWSVDTPQHSLWPHGPTTLPYGFLFTTGWFLHRQPHRLNDVARHWLPNLVIGLLLVLPTRFSYDLGRVMGLTPGHRDFVRVVHTVLYATMMWGFVLGFTGLFVRFASHPSPRWRYVADSSYWVYLVHLPLVVALQVWLAYVPLPWSLKLPLILLLTAPVLFVSYDRLVRPGWIGQCLNGHRYPRGWPCRDTHGSNAPRRTGAGTP